jgi:3',5'-cyclic AMP phosphodiesterase CpdA
MVRFIHISDLHIHGRKKTENINCEKLVAFIIGKYSAQSQPKPVVLITGDIVDDGKKKQYRSAVKLLRPLVDEGFTVLPVPGNHDYGPCGNFYTEESQAYFQDYMLKELIGYDPARDPANTMEDLFPMVTPVGGVLFIGLDSVVGQEDAAMHFASGQVGKEQREQLISILMDPEIVMGKKIVVYFHHHPFFRNLGLEMEDARQVLRILANKAGFVCFGHKHEPRVWPAESNIDWILASGKSTALNPAHKFQFREVGIDGENNEVTMITFRHED